MKRTAEQKTDAAVLHELRKWERNLIPYVRTNVLSVLVPCKMHELLPSLKRLERARLAQSKKDEDGIEMWRSLPAS